MRKRWGLVWLAGVLAALLAGCGALSDVFSEIGEDMPTAGNTVTSLFDVSVLLLADLEDGVTERTINIADVSADDLARLSEDMPTFWGRPATYQINHEFADVKGIVEGRSVNVKNVTFVLSLSNNYYAYKHIVDGEAIPEDRPHAQAVADALPGVWREIEAGLAAGASDYDKALAAHDWLVASLTYDASAGDDTDENGSYGALASRRTMCRGYAETLCLLLKCYTDIDVREAVGNARRDEGEDWIGHAWNLVYVDGRWIQVDATFDDPEGNPDGTVLHYYFGQNDTVMKANHQWNADYYPACDKESFYYFRRAGLFAQDAEDFEAICGRLLTEGSPDLLQVAGVGVSLDQESAKFLFDFETEKKILEVYWSEQSYGEIHVLTIIPKYEEA